MDYFNNKYIKSTAKKMIDLLLEKNINGKEYIQTKRRIVEYVIEAFYNEMQNLDKPKKIRDYINLLIAEKNAINYINKIIIQKMIDKYPAIKEE